MTQLWEDDALLAARYRVAVRKLTVEIDWMRKLPHPPQWTAGRLDGFEDALRILTTDEES